MSISSDFLLIAAEAKRQKNKTRAASYSLAKTRTMQKINVG